MTSHHPLWTLTTENELPEPVRRSLLLRFTDQLTHFMALLLWVAGILAWSADRIWASSCQRQTGTQHPCQAAARRG